MELFVPPIYDWIWTLVVVVIPVAMIAAIVQISRCKLLSGSAQIVWALAVLFLPLLGAIGWFVARPRESARTQA